MTLTTPASLFHTLLYIHVRTTATANNVCMIGVIVWVLCEGLDYPLRPEVVKPGKNYIHNTLIHIDVSHMLT